MSLRRYRVGVTCTASNATVFQYVEAGWLYSIGYQPGTASAYATGATATIDFITDIRSTALGITTHHGLAAFVNTSVAGHLIPRLKPQTTAFATAADLTNALMIPLADENIRIQIASGGASGNGWFDFYVQTN